MFHKVAKLSQLVDGKCLKVAVSGIDILIIKKDSEIYAINDLCTHSDYSLCEGVIEDYEIECPLHCARFDIRTGEVTAPPAFEDLQVFPVRISGDDLEVELP